MVRGEARTTGGLLRASLGATTRDGRRMVSGCGKQQVYLVDLGTGTDRSLIPLGCGLIASYAKSDPRLDAAYDIGILMLDETLEGVLDEMTAPSVVGFACYVWHFEGVKQLSAMVRERFPDTLIVWGGPSIPQEAEGVCALLEANPAVDVLVHMEGELTFADILTKCLDGQASPDLADCAGVSYRTDGTFVTTPPRARISDFTQVPSPYSTGVFDDVMARYGHFIIGILWETSRGCPFKCAFCDWGNASVNKVNRMEVDRCIAEIEWASERQLHYVYCTDANFGISVKRDLEIARQVVEVKERNGFPNTFVLNWTKNQQRSVIDIADTLRAGGIATNTTISTQSFHEPTVAAIQRGNIRFDAYNALKTAYHDRGLATYTELILGLPEETLDSFVRGIDLAITERAQDQVMVYLANVLENTQMKRDLATHGIETRRCAVGLNRRRFKFPRFGEDEIVVATRTMPVEDWQRAYLIAFLFLSLYNLRIAFYPAALLRHFHGVAVTDLVTFILDTVGAEPDRFPSFARVRSHLVKQSDLILQSVSSVSIPEGSEGVAFTPHEAATFLFVSDLDRTYTEMFDLISAFCDERRIAVSEDVLADAVSYQRARVPAFVPGPVHTAFETTVPYVMECLTRGDTVPEIDHTPTEVIVRHPDHDFDDLAEFNRRRVSSGYTISLADVEFVAPTERELSAASVYVPPARNTNMTGHFPLRQSA